MARFNPLDPSTTLPGISGKIAGFTAVPQLRVPGAVPTPLRPTPPLQSIEAAGALGSAAQGVLTTVASIAIEARRRGNLLADTIKKNDAIDEYEKELEKGKLAARQRFDNNETYEVEVQQISKELIEEITARKNFKFKLNAERFRGEALGIARAKMRQVSREVIIDNVTKWVAQGTRQEERLLTEVGIGEKTIAEAWEERLEYLDGGHSVGHKNTSAISEQERARSEIDFANKLKRQRIERLAASTKGLVQTFNALKAGGFNEPQLDKLLRIRTPEERRKWIDRLQKRIDKEVRNIKETLRDLEIDNFTSMSEFGKPNEEFDEEASKLIDLDPKEFDRIQKKSDFTIKLFNDKLDVWSGTIPEAREELRKAKQIDPKSKNLAQKIARKQFIENQINKKINLRADDPALYADAVFWNRIHKEQLEDGLEPGPLEIEPTSPFLRLDILAEERLVGPELTRTKREMETFVQRLNAANVLQKGQMFLDEQQAAGGVGPFSRNWSLVNRNAIPVEAEFLANMSMLGEEGMQSIAGTGIDLVARMSQMTPDDFSKINNSSKIREEARRKYNLEVAPGLAHIMNHGQRIDFLERVSLAAAQRLGAASPEEVVEFAFDNTYGKMFTPVDIPTIPNIEIRGVITAIKETIPFLSSVSATKRTLVPKIVIHAGKSVEMTPNMVRLYIFSLWNDGTIPRELDKLNAVDRDSARTNGRWRVNEENDGFELMNIINGIAVDVEGASVDVSFSEIIDFFDANEEDRKQVKKRFVDRLKRAKEDFVKTLKIKLEFGVRPFIRP